MGKIIGIDLGTTNACVAVLEGDGPVVIADASGEKITPSVVAYGPEGEILVGKAARARALSTPDRVIGMIISDMGTDRQVKIDGTIHTIQEAAVHVLKKLKADAEKYLGEPVADAVVAVPAMFTDKQRQAIRKAGETAGLNVRRLINAASAAAFAYGFHSGKAEKVLVVDIGGGTLDAAILELGDGMFEVIAADGDLKLGGDSFDQKIADYIVTGFRKEQGVDLSQNATAMHRIRAAAQTAKEDLSGAAATNIRIPYITADETGFKNIDMELTRERFNDMTADLARTVVASLEKIVSAGETKWRAIDRIVLVGGCSRIPAIQEKIRQNINASLYMRLDAKECVAAGAAIQGGILSGQIRDKLLMDVTSYSLGIETNGGVFTKLINRNTTIPTLKTQIFSTIWDNQQSVDIRVYQGESDVSTQNVLLGKFSLTGITPARKGVPQIEVQFNIDSNGMLSVSAKDLASGKKRSLKIDNQETQDNQEIQPEKPPARKRQKRQRRR